MKIDANGHEMPENFGDMREILNKYCINDSGAHNSDILKNDLNEIIGQMPNGNKVEICFNNYMPEKWRHTLNVAVIERTPHGKLVICDAHKFITRDIDFSGMKNVTVANQVPRGESTWSEICDSLITDLSCSLTEPY